MRDDAVFKSIIFPNLVIKGPTGSNEFARCEMDTSAKWCLPFTIFHDLIQHRFSVDSIHVRSTWVCAISHSRCNPLVRSSWHECSPFVFDNQEAICDCIISVSSCRRTHKTDTLPGKICPQNQACDGNVDARAVMNLPWIGFQPVGWGLGHSNCQMQENSFLFSLLLWNLLLGSILLSFWY